MYSNKLFLVAGGDARLIHLANLLTEHGKVCTVALDHAAGLSGRAEALSSLSQLRDAPDVLILPVPVSRDGISLYAPLGEEPVLLSHLLDLCRRDTLVLGGKPEENFLRACEARNLSFTDYLKREEFAVLNAVPTAEAALQIACRELPVSLNRQRVLITGYGRVGKLCHRLFAAAGAQVTVAARSVRDLAWAEAYGARPLPLRRMKQMLPAFRVIVNTVPACLFWEEELALMEKNVLLLDLASAPGGVDFAAAKALGLHTVQALSLPGKTSPETAGQILYQTVCNILAEGGASHD